MKVVEQRLPQDLDKSFIVFREKGTCFPTQWHYHPEYELVLIVKSSGRRMVGDHIGYFDEGDLVFIGSMLPHVYINNLESVPPDNNDAEAIVIQFVEDFLGQEFLNAPEMAAFKNFLKLSTHGLVIRGNTKGEIHELMIKMLDMNSIQRLTTLITIFHLLASNRDHEFLASPLFVQNMQLNSSERFSRITEYIMRNFESQISLHEIASVANMATATFCNFFKRSYRVTFVQYLNNVRVAHACKLLADPSENIVSVAFKCGFNTLTNFNKQFKRIKKMTPKEYQKGLSRHWL